MKSTISSEFSFNTLLKYLSLFALVHIMYAEKAENKDDVPICGGFIDFDSSMNPELKKQIEYSQITVHAYTSDMILKDHTNLAQSGYYFLPIYDNESFILKISGPYGMSFEPEQYVFTLTEGKNIRDICKNDINFKFRGFFVEGQVSTFGTNDGPAGITLALYDEFDKEIQTTITQEKGMFKFKPLLPAKYLLKPIKTTYMFDTNHKELALTVNTNGSNFFERALIIRGFRVTAKVEADSKPLEGIQAMIYSYNSTLINNYNCEPTTTVNFADYAYKGLVPFCNTVSGADGIIQFINIPFGKFIIRPLYKDNFVSYDLEPESVTLDVEHQDYTIEAPFQVLSFAIYGRVVNSRKNGIPNVTIKIDGQPKATTDVNGIYKLEQLTSGNYDLEAHADDMFFEPLTNIIVTPHLRNLQDIVVTDYKLCGKIYIEATEYYSTSKRTVVLQNTSDKSMITAERRTITDNQGRYCFEVKPGKYNIYPVLTKEEKESDLHLQPDSIDLEIIDHPLLENNFYQSKVVVSGSITCINDCDKNIYVNLVSTKTEKTYSSLINDNREFVFQNILSGQYRLLVKKAEWCWVEEEILIKVQNLNIENLKFVQSGFSMFYTSNHNIEVEWENEENKQKSQTTLYKTKSKICLPHKGSYKITPKSCQKFEESFYKYTTGSTEKLELIPVEYLVKGEILLHENARAKLSNVAGGVNLEIEITEENRQKNEKTIYQTLNYKVKDSKTVYEFYSKPNKNLIITPIIKNEQVSLKNLLFFPKFKEVQVDQDCEIDIQKLSFELRSGIIIDGKVIPEMEKVLISAYNSATNELVAKTFTNLQGYYNIGPLYTENQYNIKATKDGYKIVSDAKNQYNFHAEKLSFLRVKIQDTNGNPLPSVFLSLSSADRVFKINSNTNQDGYFDFIELFSGEYYIKPLFKEYKFEPSQKLVRIEGGKHYEEIIVAHRVAFSVYGKIFNLNKEKVEGLYIQAFNEQTKQLQETSIDKKGEYRLQALNPSHNYSIKVKIPSTSSIEKALPNSVPLTIGHEDITGVDFVVLQRPKKIDIRGYISYIHEEDKCPLAKIGNLYTELIKIDEEEDQSPVVRPVSQACQIVFRNLEKRKYHLKLFERQVKGNISTNPKLLLETFVDLGEERETTGGVRIVKLNIETAKKSLGESLTYSIYSPIFLFVMVVSLLKIQYTIKVLNVILYFPMLVIGYVRKLCKKKSHRKSN